MDIGLVAAFVGGTFALLSPCGALLLPAFFASTVGSKAQLMLHGAVFYLGLAATLVPMGLGVGALGEIVTTHRGVVIAATAAVLITAGIAQVFGWGFDLARLLPRPSTKGADHTGWPRTFFLGATGGVAGFCTGPILGAILTMAMARGDTISSGMLLAVYGLGMVVPLIGIAAVWERMGNRGQRVLRGRGFRLAGRQFHTTSVISGVLMVTVGIVFWRTNGLLDAPSLISTASQSRLQERAGDLAGPLVDIVAVLAVGAVGLMIWSRTSRSHLEEQTSDAGLDPDRRGGDEQTSTDVEKAV